MGRITDSNYRQCRLRRPQGEGEAVTVSWLPVKYARVGRVVQLRDGKDNPWVDGWEVVAVSSTEIGGEKALARSRAHLGHRAHSDI